MNAYKVTLNGKVYEFTIELINKDDIKAAPAAAPAPAASGTAGGYAIKTPLPGVIIDVKVNVGDTVAKGQTVAILEAMKMENNINSDRDGKVTSISVSKGETVADGAVLITLE